MYLQKLLGVAGERAEQPGSGFWWFIQLGGKGMLYFFPSKRNCLIYVCLLQGKRLATKQKQILTEAFLRALRE